MGAKRSLAEIAAELAAPKTGACKVCAYLRTASERDAEFLQAQLDLPLKAAGHKFIMRMLRGQDYEISDTAVATHRFEHMEWVRGS